MHITTFGEVLWDDFPQGKILGGAPLNVAVRLRALGADAAVISRCGNDEDGQLLLEHIRSKHLPADWIQTDESFPTGLARVHLDDKGSASYDIVYPCAWDKIVFDEQAAERVAQSDAFVFGSLAARNEVSRQTLDQLLQRAKFKVFDVNLRAPHYNSDRILDTMRRSDLVKLNDDELYLLAEIYGSPYRSIEQNTAFLAQKSGVGQICITLGNHGALFYRDGEFRHHCGFRVDSVDTVGAGDNFLAGLVFCLLKGMDDAAALEFACALGSLAVSRRGATPHIDLAEIENLMRPREK